MAPFFEWRQEKGKKWHKMQKAQSCVIAVMHHNIVITQIHKMSAILVDVLSVKNN